MAKFISFFWYAVLFPLIFAVITEQDISLTFQWYNEVEAEKVQISEHDRNPKKHLVEYTSLHKQIKGQSTLLATNFSSEYPDAVAWTESEGFVDTVFYSYQKHHNLIIRPDDIWTAIIVQLSLYVNARADELRNAFVTFDGKKELIVKFEAPIDQVPMDEFITKIVDLITENINPTIYNWISPNFTTTTESDRLTAGVAMMATLQKYFSYSIWSVLCGIPRLTISGTVDDWREIRNRVDRLNYFELKGKNEMTQWSSMLSRILDQFVSAKEGNYPDNVFWKQALRVDYKIVDMTCTTVEQTYLNGWITAFSAFDRFGQWQGPWQSDSHTVNSTPTKTEWLSIRTDFITPGMVHIPIQIHDEFADPDKRDYTGAIITGHIGYAVKDDERTVQSLSGWAMVITSDPPHYLSYD